MEEEIYLSEIFSALKKRSKLIIIISIIFMLAGFGVSKFLIVPKYEAKTTIILGNVSDYDITTNPALLMSGIKVNQELVTTYSELIRSRKIEQQVIDNLELKNFSTNRLDSMLEVNTVKDTEIIYVSVTDTIPERAMDIANETAEIFQRDIKDILNVNNVQILDSALLPKNPVSPNIKRNTAAGAVLGLMLSCLYAVFRELSDDRIKSAEDLEGFNYPVLGTIPEVAPIVMKLS